jgi:aryl-phospho-beta-D-glucosidase BglC (GH1 family)
MRGLNFGGWFSQIDAIEEKDPKAVTNRPAHIQSFLRFEDFKRVKDWGFDHIRLPIDWQNAFDSNINPNEKVLGLLDKAVEGILSCDLELILDLHKCPGHDFYEGTTRDQAFFSDPKRRRDCLRVWEHLAERYGCKKGVILEILNEPVAPDSETWNTVKDELAQAIRKAAPASTILVGSNRWNSAAEFDKLRPIDDDNVVYSFHFYLPMVFTHQKAPWCPGSAFGEQRPYPGTYKIANDGATRHALDEEGSWNKDRLARCLEPVFTFRERYKLPVACNEFGVYMGGADSESRYAWLTDFMDLLNEAEIGWTYWNYKNLDFGVISVGERLFESAPQYEGPDRVDRRLLEILQAH